MSPTRLEAWGNHPGSASPLSDRPETKDAIIGLTTPTSNNELSQEFPSANP